jgi:hypothetical protein
LDGGEFPISISTYTTVSKAPWCGVIDQEESCYLDMIHVDIAFGDCVALGGYRYALIFVDQAIRYNWVFGLKIYPAILSSRLSISFMVMQALMLNVFGQTATLNILAPKSANISLTMTQTLLRQQQVVL